MYICKKCGRIIEELPTYIDHIGNFGNEPVYERVENDKCSCGGYFEEADICCRCEELKSASDFENGMCTNCQAVIMERFHKLLSENFKVNEIAFIFENWED